MAGKAIVFEIKEGGEVEVVMDGFSGKECTKAMKEVVHADFLKNGKVEETADMRKVSKKTKAKA